MKLSEMNTQKAAACLAELALPIAVLAKNPAVKQYIDKAKNNEATISLAIDAFASLLPVFLRDHYQEMIKVLSILTEKSVKEIDEQTMKQTLADIKDVFDGDLQSFFT